RKTSVAPAIRRVQRWFFVHNKLLWGGARMLPKNLYLKGPSIPTMGNLFLTTQKYWAAQIVNDPGTYAIINDRSPGKIINEIRHRSSMTISQKTTPEENAAGPLSCPHCNAALPPQATFCGSCGERVEGKKQTDPLEEQDIQTHYRIKTLVRRYPHSNLYFALDNSQAQEAGPTRMVAIRDIDIAGMEKEAREQAVVLAQQEYDCLRRWNLPHTLSCIDLRVFQGHLFLISALPGSAQETSANHAQQRLY